jgi:hypothetical protein
MKITDKFILRCMRHTFIWTLDISIMYAAYHLQHFLPPILFTLIMAVGGCIFAFYLACLVWGLTCLLCDDDFFEDKN